MTTTTFASLGLDPMLLKALETEGYTTPTPIQAQAIPAILEGKDLLGIAQTGTGKTAAFALPILHRLAANPQPAMRKGIRALILSPTRELASQIGESFRTYGRHMGLTVAVVFGGVAHRPQRDQLSRGVDILVATPGRLLDHMTERNVMIEGTEILVLDEADQMMDLGFIRPLRQIVSKLSHRRQSLFFSATMPHEIGALAAELLKDPVKVSVAPVAKTADRVAQEVIFVEQARKRALLAELFTNPDLKRAIVFTRTKRGADKVARYLEVAGVPVAAIHGNKSQGQRDAALGGFKAGKIRALIATDIAARGIDVDAVSHVINFEVPNVPESYVHRIGRTARAGAEGIAISLVDHEERAYLRDIERLTRQQIPSKDRRGDATLIVATDSAADRRAEDDAERERPRFARGDRSSGGFRRPAREGGRDSEQRGPRGNGSGRSDGNRPSFARGPEGRGDRRDERRAPRRDVPAADRAPSNDWSVPREVFKSSEQRPARAFDAAGSDSRGGERGAPRKSGHRKPFHAGEGRGRSEHGEHRRPEGARQNSEPRSGGGGDRRQHHVSGEARPRHGNGDTRAHDAHGEGRARPSGAHHRSGDGAPTAGRSHGQSDRQGRPPARSGDAPPNGHGKGNGPSGKGGSGGGLEGVHFLNNRGGQRPRGNGNAPRANDRQRARPRPA